MVQLIVETNKEDIKGHHRQIQKMEFRRKERSNSFVDDTIAIGPQQDLEDEDHGDREINVITDDKSMTLSVLVRGRECTVEEIDDNESDENGDKKQCTK
jgi:hypothetical protein